MKNFLSFFMLAILLVSCSSPSDKFAEQAEVQAKKTIMELAKHPETVKTDNFRRVYTKDSLCIVHFDFTAKNGLGNETTDLMEYVYYRENNTTYEACYEADEDTVFVNTSLLEKQKKGKIYESLDYDSSIAYRAIMKLNSNGRVVGNSEESVEIEVPTGTGLWELKSYKDDFGDETGEHYLILHGNGTFSNSATTGSKMSAILFADRDSYSIRLIEYNSSIVKDDEKCTLKVKDSEGDVYYWTLFNSNSGQMYLYSTAREEMTKILSRGGVVTFYAEMGKYSKSTYKFKFDVSGYKKAKNFL